MTRRITALALGLTLLLAGGARAATITVTTTSDEANSVDGAVSIREAISSVNAGSDLNSDVAAHRAGAAYGTNDTVVIHSNANHYGVTTGELSTTKTVSLVGDGPATTVIDGGLSNRILHSTVGSAGSLTVSGLTFTRGSLSGTGALPDGGGAIKVDAGVLNVTGAAFTSNSATLTNATGTSGGGAIWAGGNATINGTAFSKNSATVNSGNANGGGAVFVDNATVSLTDDRFSGDTFTQTSGSANEGGGGLYDEAGAITVTRTSFSGETVSVAENGGSSGGGAIYDDGGGTRVMHSSFVDNKVTINPAVNVDGGGAIYADGGGGDDVNVTDTTIARNTVNLSPSTAVNSGGGGIFSGGGPVTLTNDTVSGNSLTIASGGQASDGGGALFNYGPGTLTNDTIAGNSANTPGGGLLEVGDTQTLKNTIVAKNTAPSGSNCAGATIASNGNNIEDADTCHLTKFSDRRKTNPLLGPLQNNGGSTLTRALLPGSPAIDRGDNSACPAADQRGVSRPQPIHGTCDIGAFEVDRSPPTITITRPVNGAHYKQGQKVLAAYSCSDPGGLGGVASCQGPAPNGKPIDTSTVGRRAFTVQASDRAGNASKKTVHYTVDTTQSSPPGISGFPPNEGCVSHSLKIRISVHPTNLNRVKVFLDGKKIFETTKATFKLTIPASTLHPGRHKLRIARDYKSGTKRTSSSSFAVCRGGGRSPHIRTEGTPDQGTCTARAFSVVVTVKGSVLSTIVVKLDGKPFAKPGKSKFTLSVGVAKLKPGRHRLTIRAADNSKNSSFNITDFVRCG